MINILIYFLIILFLFKTEAKNLFIEKPFTENLKIYDKLNNYETISEAQIFGINTTEKSYAYFDSCDNNTHFWISQNYSDLLNHKDTRITGKFYQIEPNKVYYIRSIIWANPSVIKKYLYPININENEININNENEEINFLYFEANKNYTLNFQENINKKMIKLSHKTIDSKVKVIINDIEEAELNKDGHYYKINEDFKGKIRLEIKDENALLEFLSYIGNYQILTNTSYEKNKIENDNLIIQVPKTPKNFQLTLSSDKPFNYSLSYGISDDINYYYYSKNNPSIPAEYNNESHYSTFVELIGVFKSINLLENEFLSFNILLKKEKNQEIYLEYHQFSLLDKVYDEEISEEYCTDIIKNLKDVFEIYVYSDIAKNPPIIENEPNYHHKPINFQEELDKISIHNRKFYEFYQEIQKILTSTRDLHFSIVAHKTPKGIPFAYYEASLPFNFEIRKDNKGKFRIFIKENLTIKKYDNDTQNFIYSHLNIPLKTINDIEPFEYIQNWSQYRRTKNPHAQFVFIIDEIIKFRFCSYPVDYYELYNEYEFDDNEIRKISYHFENLKGDNNEYHNSHINNFPSLKPLFEIPHFNSINDEFLQYKGFEQKQEILKDEKIIWDILYEENDGIDNFYIKCRFDKKNKVNILVQNSFSLNFKNGTSAIFDCAKLFYSNEFPLIIIETRNNGGDGRLAMIFNQILQLRITERAYDSYRLSEISKDYFYFNKFNSFVDVETCKEGHSFSDTREISDHYKYNNLDIEHKRIRVIDQLDKTYRNALNNFREQYFNSSNLKKPTDIIIFTDSYSLSAASVFIKGFQSRGGAIIVGYYGNPYKNGTELFDSSQSSSEVKNLYFSDIYPKLEKLGFTILGVTIGESYDDFYQMKIPIPLEYQFDPVDYRADIYSHYSDDIYETFIKEGLEVHKLFNNGSYCNYKNNKLLMHNDTCYKIEGDEFAHGGFVCNEGKWSTDKCKGYYCDIGYYYDQFENKCKKECPYYENRKYFIIFEKDLDKTFNIEPKMMYQFEIFNRENYIFSFETTRKSIGNYPKLFFQIHGEHINIQNNENEILPVRIKSLNPSLHQDLRIQLPIITQFNDFHKIFEKGKYMYLLQSSSDSIFHTSNILNLSKVEVKLAEYNDDMDAEEILKINDGYFTDVIEKFIYFKKEQLYIIYYNFEKIIEFDLWINALKDEFIYIKDNNNSLYLEINKNYTLDFVNYEKKYIMIKLSRKTINSEVILINENIRLNSNNLYYKLDENFSGKLNIRIEKGDALIEILDKKDDDNIETIDFEEKKELNIIKIFTFIRIPKNTKDKIINICLNKEGTSRLLIYHDYSLPNYSTFYPLNNDNEIELNNFSFNITNHYENGINLMVNESYYLIIQTNKNNTNINVKMQIIDNKQNGEDKEKNGGLKTWHIILISISSVIVILVIIIIVYCSMRKNITNEDIENKVESLTKID